MMKKRRAKYFSFGSYLKKARMRRELSQKAVARVLGYESAQFISNWERGISMPPLDRLRGLKVLYKIPTSQLIKVLMKQEKARILAFFN